MDGRRVPREEKVSWETKDIDAGGNREIMRLIAIGLKNTDIAKRVGRSPQAISYIRNSLEIETHVQLLQKKRDELVIETLEAAPKALTLYKNAINDGVLDPNIGIANQLKAAGKLLEVGLPNPKALEGEGKSSAPITNNVLIQIQQRAEEYEATS